MRMICLVFVTALLTNLQFMTPDHAAAAKESVTIELNADLLKRALAQNVDLASILEAQLQAQLGSSAAAAPTAYLPFLTGAIDNFEAMIFAPWRLPPTRRLRRCGPFVRP